MSNSPAYNICTIIPARDEAKPDKFLEIGAAWWSKNGDALNLVFEAHPVQGNRVVLIPNKPKNQGSEL